MQITNVLVYGVLDMNDHELLIRIDANVANMKADFDEFKKITSKRLDGHDKKLSMHGQNFGDVNVRFTEQDGKIATGKFWKTLIGIVLGLAAILTGLAAWVKP